jgi:hypothetical protein
MMLILQEVYVCVICSLNVVVLMITTILPEVPNGTQITAQA